MEQGDVIYANVLGVMYIFQYEAAGVIDGHAIFIPIPGSVLRRNDNRIWECRSSDRFFKAQCSEALATHKDIYEKYKTV